MKKVNKSNFKKTLSKFVTGIAVVCVKRNQNIYGKTINSFNSLSLDPPLVLFSLGNYSSSKKIFLDTKYLTVNILSKKQKKISDNFAQKIPEISEYKFIKGNFNTVLIPNCIGYLECKVIDKIKKGDHTIFICKVLNLNYKNKIKPLSYFNSKYL